MCGIAGALSPAGIDPAVLPGMGDAIRHRGPDGEGYLLHAPGGAIRVLHEQRPGASEAPATVGFAHRRLAIIDLSEASDQPMVDESQRLAIAYNGELYNYVELRNELAAAGRPPRTEGDTEVVLNAYAEWGPDCLRRMVGMWAFAILDPGRRTLFLAVDRFGIKPLYYALAGGALYFGSEIKALLAVPSLRPDPDEDVARRFLANGRVDDTPQTFFDGVTRLPPAHYAEIPLDEPVAEPAPRRYWDLPAESFRGSPSDAASEFAERFAESVRVHLRSDVPVGTCLSGGIDSSAIVCVADELRHRGEVPRYAHLGFGYLPQDESVSERRYMEMVVAKTGIEMNFVKPSVEELIASLQQIVRQQDEPFGSTSIAAQWFVFGAAHAQGMKVMLDGQGADEVLGGYHGYLQSIGLAHLRARRPLAYARFNRAYRRLTGAPVAPLRQALALLRQGPTGPGHAPESINEILAAHTTSLGLPSLLRFEDRNAMAHSIEARVPFLDHRLVEFAFSLPGDLKVKGVETKHVLREAMDGVLPEAIRTRTDKIGFRAEPTATWELAERHRDSLLANRTPYEERWFDPGEIEALLGSGRDQTAEFMLWRLVNLKLWLRTFWGEDKPLASSPS